MLTVSAIMVRRGLAYNYVGVGFGSGQILGTTY